MDGGNYLPQATAQTWSTRYGDCKAKTLLLLALLDALEVEAQPVLASLGLGDHVASRLPSPAAFNHVLVRATVDGKPLWLDGTGRGTRLGDIGDVPAIGFVLPLRAAGAEPVKLVPTVPARPMFEMTFDYDQRAGARMPTLVTATIVVRGGPAEQLYLGSTQATAEQKVAVAQSMLSEFFDDVLIEDPSFTYDADAAEATMKANGLVTSLFRRQDGRFRFALDRPLDKISFEPDRARAAWRDIPVRADAPGRAVIVSRVRLPDGDKGYALEGNRSFAGALAGTEITRTARLEGDMAVVEDRVTSAGAEIVPGEIAATRAAVARAKARPLQLLAPAELPERWTIAGPANRKALTPLIAFYDRTVAAAEPDQLPIMLRNRARFHAGIYDYAAALKDVARLAEVEATAENQRWLASLLRNAGREKEAIAASEAALALDPADIETLNQLTELYALAGATDKALALLAEPIEAGGDNKAALLAMRANVQRLAGRADEAVASAEAAVTVAGNNAMAFNQRCWNAALLDRALDRAVQDCTRAIELGGSASALDSRALAYFRLKRTEEALADLNAALAVNPELPESLYMRGIIPKHRGEAAASAADLTAARLISPTIDRDYVPFGIKP